MRGRSKRFKIAAGACIALLASTSAAPIASIAEARTSYRTPRIAIQKSNDESPLLLLVSIGKQRIRAFDSSGELSSSRISTGQPGFDTPTGVFSILEKKVYHTSNIYEGAPMPHMQRLTWSGIALHAGVVPGYRASHGCIRLPASFAKSLYDITRVGGRVIVTPEEIDPIPFSHPNLLKPLPAENPPALARYGATKVAANDQGPRMAEFPKLFGVTSALAEAAREPGAFLPARPRSRAEARLLTAAKLQKIKDDLRNAQSAKDSASDKARAALEKSRALAPKVEEANKVLSSLRDSIAAAEKDLASVMAAFEAFHTGTISPKSTDAQTPALDESELEQSILDARADVDAARADLVRAELEFATLLGSAVSAEKAKADAEQDVRDAVTFLRTAQGDLIDYNREVASNNKNISIFVSMKAERIYVRQGQEPLLEAPITVNDPQRRYGTHVFTAMQYDTGGDNLEWRLVSAQLPAMQYRDADDNAGGKKKRRPRTQTLPYSDQTSIRQANDALDAIAIPSEILETIRDRVRPGTSMIVSDHELPANENGLGTEFVVLTR